MSSYLEWNILLAVLAAELVPFHVRCLQTKWDLGGFVFCLSHSDAPRRECHTNKQHSLTLSVVTFDEIHLCNYSLRTFNGKMQWAAKRHVLFLQKAGKIHLLYIFFKYH